MVFFRKLPGTTIYLLLVVVLLAVISPRIYSGLTLLVEKYSLKAPPKLEDKVKGVVVSASGRIKYPHDVTIVMVGDSMTEKLGNSDEIRGFLKEYYPNKTVEVLNYGFGATNILSVQERLEKETFHGRKFAPILNIDFDIILIESFGHNPLSEFSLEEGLKKQEQALDKVVSSIKSTLPNAKIIFVATIAPNRETYALQSRDLTPEVRAQWAEERMAYIRNHIKYANSHNIPVIDIFKKSLDDFGDGKLIYIDEGDYIHPSPTGIIFISKKIADFIYKLQLLY